MARACVNPEELRAFAGHLSSYLDTIDDETSRLNADFQNLRDGWNDAKAEQFEEEFEELMNAVRKFSETAEEEIPQLYRMAESSEEYLRS